MHRQKKSEGLTFRAYRGDGCSLLAFDVDESLVDDLAGFAVRYTTPDGQSHRLWNRLNFDDPVTATTTPEERHAVSTPTQEAPLQAFHWTHFPPDVTPGDFTYTATAMLFKTGTEKTLEPGPSAELKIDLTPPALPKLELGFTRGYLSSQAYADRFQNAPIAPDPLVGEEQITFDTAPFEARYEWLGFHARKLVFDFLDEAIADPNATVDAFAFDLDEPDLIAKLCTLGPRLRILLDDSDSHTQPDKHGNLPPEVYAAQHLVAAAGEDNVKRGHFVNLAHQKVFILRRNGAPVKVLAGSANFSVRGLYVQSNNVFVFDDEGAAAKFEDAFAQAWGHPLSQFDTSDVAAKWLDLSGEGLPATAVSFAPHADATVSLQRVADAIKGAHSSVLFAVMEIGKASGPVVDELRKLPRPGLYAFGTTQKLDGDLKTISPSDPSSPFLPFAYLHEKVPPPFRAESSGGFGQVIHHKFVVCDFNGAAPVVYAGSSNLAAGGEHRNGDNLVEFRDREVATRYAVQALGLIDHYRFRAVQNAATTADPLRLKTRSEHWAHDFFDPASPRSHERTLFAHGESAP